MPLLSLPIVASRSETPRNRIVRLALGGIPFPFQAGQYVLLGARGQGDRRPYSVACSPGEAAREEVLEFLIQVGQEGSPGPHMPSLDVGEVIDVEGPEGSFTLPGGRLDDDLLLVAGGTGIAPLRSILRQVLEDGGDGRVGLVLSGRSPEELAYAGELRELALGGRIRLVETVTRGAPASWQGVRGRIGRAQLEAAMTASQPLCYVCGPDSLVDEVPRLLVGLGVPPSRIFTEQWTDQPARALRA